MEKLPDGKENSIDEDRAKNSLLNICICPTPPGEYEHDGLVRPLDLPINEDP
jgi:hypothetical protein